MSTLWLVQIRACALSADPCHAQEARDHHVLRDLPPRREYMRFTAHTRLHGYGHLSHPQAVTTQDQQDANVLIVEQRCCRADEDLDGRAVIGAKA